MFVSALPESSLPILEHTCAAALVLQLKVILLPLPSRKQLLECFSLTVGFKLQLPAAVACGLSPKSVSVGFIQSSK
jgi:hypothetical protein